MKRGAKPIPAEIKEVTGNPGRRPIKKGAASRGSVGAPPRDMGPAASAKWHEMADAWRLVLKHEDRDALTLYCDAWAEMVNAQERVREDGAMILTPNGMVQKSPWLSKVEQCREFCRKMLAEFGGSPSARMRVAGSDDEDEDPLAEFIN